MLKKFFQLFFAKKKKQEGLNFSSFTNINGFKCIRVRSSEDARRKMNIQAIHAGEMLTADIIWLKDGTGILKIRSRKTAL